MERIVSRRLPDGSIRTVKPYHISLEGHSRAILCREEKDYDAMVKILCVAARRKNVIVIIYAVVSNHCHAAVLAVNQSEAYEFGWEVKRIFSMWFSRWYGRTGVMRGIDVKAIPLDSDSYVRNALAYIPRNALDNGCNVNEYKWSGFRAMFSQAITDGRAVRVLTKRETEQIMHTGDNLSDVAWALDAENSLIPRSWCDYQYLEQAFGNDQAFFLKIIGDVNSAQMHQTLIENPRTRLVDGEMFKYANSLSVRWFKMELDNLALDSKYRLAKYLYRTMNTSVPQLERTLDLERDKVYVAIGQRKEGVREVPGENGEGRQG